MSTTAPGSIPDSQNQPLVFWLPSACRSVAPLCEEVARQHAGPVTVILQQLQTPNRTAMGWQACAFEGCDVQVLPAGVMRRDVAAVLQSHTNSFHIFGSYHKSSPILAAAVDAARRKIAFGMLSEAPLSMRTGASRLIHQFYMTTLLPIRVREVVRAARFLLCESGSDFTALTSLGWSPRQLFPFGYFPAPPPYQAARSPSPFLRILSVGGLSVHKGNHVLVEACRLLAQRRIPFQCDIVGDGLEREPLTRLVLQHRLHESFRFHGFVDDAALSHIARQCSVLACPGLEEPWGIRVNDAIHAGFIPVVSRGVGASQIVARFGAGLIFPASDSIALAECFSLLHGSPSACHVLQERVAVAAQHISPAKAADYLRAVIGYCTHADAERPSPAWL